MNISHDLRTSAKLARASLTCLAIFLWTTAARGQFNPLAHVSITPITDNNPATNEVGRDRASINSTPFKNESLWTVGDYQFGTMYREDGKLMVIRRDLTAPTNHWDIRVTEFTSYNINDAHNVPVIGLDGDGYLHLAWGTHGNPLLYTRSNTPVTSGQAMTFIGDTVGNSAAPNTMTGTNETGTTYPNFVKIPGSDDLLFNYRTGGSGNGTYRLAHWDDSSNTWSWNDQTWIKNTDSSGLTYNAYPHNMTYDETGGLHATWTYRYNSSSPTGNSGYQTNHNLHYAYSPDNGVTWFKDIGGTIAYPADIDESNSQVIVNIPEGSSLINTGTQAIDKHDRPAIATWWAPHAHDAEPDHRRQYMYVGHDGNDWFTSQITHRTFDDPNKKFSESQLGQSRVGRPQILFDEYNRAFVVFSAASHGGGIMVAYSQAESRDDWEFIELTTANNGGYTPTPDRALWDATGQMHFFIQPVDGNSSNGGSDAFILEWDVQTALGRVLEWTGQNSATWNTSTINFTDQGVPDDFDNFDNVIFDDGSAQKTVTLSGNLSAGKVVVDSTQAYTFTGSGALTEGSLAVVGGGSLELATDGNTYAGQTRVSNATLKITGDATTMTSRMIAAAGGTLIMDSSDASTMASAFEIWPTGVLEIGSPTTTGNPFPDNPTSIMNDGLIRVKTTETLRNVEGMGTIEAAAGVVTLESNGAFAGAVRIKSGATVVAASVDALGNAQGDVTIEDGGQLRFGASGSYGKDLDVSGDGGGGGAVVVDPGANVAMTGLSTVQSSSTAFGVGTGGTGTVERTIGGAGGLTKVGGGTLRLEGGNTYAGDTIVRDGVLAVESATGFGDTTVESGGTLEAAGTVRGNLAVLSGGVARLGMPGTTPSGALFADDFNGSGGPLNGTTPDVSFDGSTWVAAPTFEDDGDSVSGGVGGSATLAFTPEDGQTYVLEASIDNIVGDTDWFGLGFANGQSPANSSNARFITGDVTGIGWAMYRGTQSSGTNQTFLGDLSVGTNPGLASGAAWLADATAAGGSVDMRLTLDTTGGAGRWTILMEADTGSGFQTIRAVEMLLDESITSVGIANSNANDLTGRITAFSLSTDTVVPTPTSAVLIDGDLNLSSGATLEVLGALAGDVATVNGTANLAGVLDMNALDTSAAVLGDTLPLIAASAVNGTFAQVTGVEQAGNLGLAVRYGSTAVDVRLSIRGDTDFDDDVDTADLTAAIIGFNGASGTGSTWTSGDFDGDGDTDTVDLTNGIINFTGASSANPNVPDLIYDPATGNVTIDADGADVISFSLQSGPFNAADFSELPAGLTDNIAGQIGWTSFNLFSGLTGAANLGAILPAGMDLAQVEAALSTASYGLALSGGGGGGRLDIIIPEPASMALMGLGMFATACRRRAA